MRSRIPALVVACLLVLTGCGDDATEQGTEEASDSASPSAPETSETSGAAEEAEGSGATTYVALGDSYTAAPLVPETDPQDPCLRSSNNYPAKVVAAMPDLELTDVSCSGADSASLVGVQTIGSQVVAPQFDALDEDTDVVTIGLGGNDFGLFGSLLADCASSSDVDAAGQPCTDAVTSGAKSDLTEILPQLETRIEAVITGVRDRAPDARVVVVGYPRLLPASGSCDALAIATGDLDYVRQLDEGLSASIAQAATAQDADYVDVYAASEGHDICSADPWVNGNKTQPGAALAYHPFAEEQQAVADLVAAVLEG